MVRHSANNNDTQKTGNTCKKQEKGFHYKTARAFSTKLNLKKLSSCTTFCLPYSLAEQRKWHNFTDLMSLN